VAECQLGVAPTECPTPVFVQGARVDADHEVWQVSGSTRSSLAALALALALALAPALHCVRVRAQVRVWARTRAWIRVCALVSSAPRLALPVAQAKGHSTTSSRVQRKSPVDRCWER